MAVRWLEALLVAHAGHLLSQADLMQSFGPILSLIDAKLALLSEISKLKGRISLITGQISQSGEEQHKEVSENCFVYQDTDSSEEDGGIEDDDIESESDENWEEMSNQDDQDEQDEQNDQDIKSTNSNEEYENERQDDNESISS